jgi:hypothetical protein
MLESPALGRPLPYVAFDNNVGRVQAAQEAGFNVLFGDGTRKAVSELLRRQQDCAGHRLLGAVPWGLQAHAVDCVWSGIWPQTLSSAAAPLAMRLVSSAILCPPLPRCLLT